MSSNDLKNQPFQWDLLYNLYKPQLSTVILDQNLFADSRVNSIFANFIISYSYEKGTQVKQDKDKALEMYKYNSIQLLDPLSCYRLAEIYSIKLDMNVDPNFQYSWYYLLIFSSLIEPFYDIDFFKGTEWLMRVLKQADPTFSNSFSLIKELINPDLEPLCDVIQNLLLIKLNIIYENKTNQERYNETIDHLISILETSNQSSPNLLYCTYNILFGLSFRNFNQVLQRQYHKILNSLSLNIELTLNKAKELQIESIFSVNLIGQNGNGMSYERYDERNLTPNQINQVQETDEIIQNVLQTIYQNATIKAIDDLILCRRIHTKLLYINNINFEKALNIISQELTLPSNNKNTQAFAEYQISKIFFKTNQLEKAIQYGESSIQKFNNRIQQESNDPIIMLYSYFFKGRMQEKLDKDKSQALQTYIEAMNIYINFYTSVFSKENSFQFILYQKRLIKHILKISTSTTVVDNFVKKAEGMQIQLYLPKSYAQKKRKDYSPQNQSPNKTYSFGKTKELQNQQFQLQFQPPLIDFFGQKYLMCQGEEDIDIVSQRDCSSLNNSSQNVSMSNNGISKLSSSQVIELNLGGSLSSYQSIQQYTKNEQLNFDDQFVFELTKQYALNDCKMVQLDCKDIKMKGMIKKGDLGAVYGVRYFQEYYAAKKQFQQFLDFQNKIPHCLNLLNLLGYATSNNKDGAINLYLISEMKRSNLENSMLKNELTRIEQKIKIIDQLTDCVNTLHKNNVYHSNIKDTNILLDSHCNVYLSDLSVSRVFKDYEFGENAFKQPYASPEQIFEEEPKNGKPGDMWAIGIIALQLFTNIKKFTTEIIEELSLYSKVDFKLSTLSSSPIPEVNKLENLITQFIESILRYEPKKRITSQQAIQEMEQIKACLDSIKKSKS